jgi:acyl-CoA reductase-like NAD-dependent aldehyde dehydrogenase
MGLPTDKETNLEVVPLFIDGKYLPISASRLRPVISSRSGQPVYLYHSATASETTHACDVAWASFQTWKKTNSWTRRDIVLRAADLAQERAAELIAIQVAETNCTEEYARFATDFLIKILRELASRVSSIQGHTPQAQTPDTFALTIKQPVGPVLVVSPWNSPNLLAGRAIACPLLAGCSVVFKASEMSPRTHHALVQIFHDAGIPAGVLNALQADREVAAEVTEAIIAHRAIKKVEFTGSNPVGSSIGQLCMKYLKPIFMELGGKSPAIVLEDANLERAASLIVRGAFLHHGQICVSTERVIVVETIADKLIALITKEAETIPHAGAAVSERIASHAESLVAEAVARGAKAIVGGPGYVDTNAARPTILVNVTPDMKIYDEESFGPSCSIYVVKDGDEAVELANWSKYGLSASIHTEDMLRFIRLASEIEVGQVGMNTMTLFEECKSMLSSVSCGFY